MHLFCVKHGASTLASLVILIKIAIWLWNLCYLSLQNHVDQDDIYSFQYPVDNYIKVYGYSLELLMSYSRHFRRDPVIDTPGIFGVDVIIAYH